MAVDLGVEAVWRDVRYSLRQLGKNYVFALTVILTIALGMGATVGVFSVVHAVLLRPLPYRNPARLVVAYGDLRRRNASELALSSPDFQDLQRGTTRTFEEFSALYTYKQLMAQSDGTQEQVTVAGVTTNFFPMMGAKVLLGRGFESADGVPDPPDTPKPGADDAGPNFPSVAVLSYEFWKRRYGGNPAVLGQRVWPEMNRSPVIVGVLAPGFSLLFPEKLTVDPRPDIWMAARLKYDNSTRNSMQFTPVGRLKPGVSLDAARAEVETASAEMRRNSPISATADFHVELKPMHAYLVEGLRPAILALMGAAVFLLLIACANVANLLLVRMSLRERELAVRTALGGRRADIVRQVLTECLLLAGAGTVLGLALAWIGVREFSEYVAETQPLLASIGIDPMVVGAAVLCGLCAALLFGIGPALYASRPDVMTVLRTSGRTALLGGGKVLRTTVIAVEIALSFALLTGAGLMLRSFVALQRIDPGFVAKNMYTFEVLEPWGKTPEARAVMMRQVADALRTMPGVKGVTAAAPFPLADVFSAIRWGTADALGDASKYRATDFQFVQPGYFEVMKTPLLEGRTFTDADNSPAQSLVVVDEYLAAKAFPHESAIGKRILVRFRGPQPEFVQIIGVVQHQRDSSLADPGREQVYFLDGYAGYQLTQRWAIRTSGDPAGYERMVKDRMQQLSRQIVVTEMKPMDVLVAHAQETTRLSFALIGVFAVVAGLLSALGIYGVLATSVRQRRAEIGVRLALGASRPNIFKLIVGDGMRLGAIGIGSGIVVALALTHWIASLLVGVKPWDPVTFVGIAVTFLVIVGLAAWLPARRAAGIDPMEALRSE